MHVERRRSARLMGSSTVAPKVGAAGSGDVEVEMETGGSEVEDSGAFEGWTWTRDQEATLRRAYISARPSPYFWKMVSKMVPGKSAQECFNRIHADLVTPAQRQPRSRENKLNSSPVGCFTMSGSIQTKAKRFRSKQKSFYPQRTARHLIRKHCLIDQSQEADHFSNLETSPYSLTLELPEIKSPETPNGIMNRSSFLQKCNESSSSAHKRMLSRFKMSRADPSPEVLKQIKNIVLHERYINHLHCRDARRRTSAKTANSVADRCDKTNTELEIGVLKAARTALISEARDYISHLQQMQANSLNKHESFGSDDDNADTDDYVDDYDG